MAIDIDGPPVYDWLTKETKNHMSDVWIDWFSTFYQTLTEYLTQNGMKVPRLTTAQRDAIQNPELGQIIYNTTDNEYQGRKSIAGIQQWVNFDTTP